MPGPTSPPSRTAAVRDGDEWRITGTKVWTSNAMIVSYGMLLARTNWDVPKHRGLSFFLCPAQQPGVQPRPIKQMNGRSEFNLVHFEDAIVADADLLGGEGEGWPVTRTFLTYEKNSFNPAAHEGGPFGPVDLTRPAGELVDEMVRGTAAPAAATAASGASSTSSSPTSTAATIPTCARTSPSSTPAGRSWATRTCGCARAASPGSRARSPRSRSPTSPAASATLGLQVQGAATGRSSATTRRRPRSRTSR